MSTSDADRKLLALGIKATKFTVEELQKLLEGFLKSIQNGLIPERKQYIDFQNPGGVPLLNLSTENEDMTLFSDTARQNQVNHTLKRDRESGTYYLCLQGKQENIEKSIAEYQKKMQVPPRSRRPSVAVQLEQAKKRATAHQSREKQPVRENTRV